MEKQIKVKASDLKIMLINTIRYSIGRDNHLAPDFASEKVKQYLPLFDQESQKYLVEKFKGEIKSGIQFHEPKEYLYVWQELTKWLDERQMGD